MTEPDEVQDVGQPEEPMKSVSVDRRTVLKGVLGTAAVAAPLVTSVKLGVLPAYAEGETPNISGGGKQTQSPSASATTATPGSTGSATTVEPSPTATTSTTTTTTTTTAPTTTPEETTISPP